MLGLSSFSSSYHIYSSSLKPAPALDVDHHPVSSVAFYHHSWLPFIKALN